MNNTAKFMVQDLDFFYGNMQALNKINMTIHQNEITAFIGPSGCGKSTFLRTLNRMNDLIEEARVEGTILLDNQDVYKELDIIKLRSRIGMVFQKPNPFSMSVYDNIAYGPRIHGITKKSILDEIVEKSLRQASIWDEVSHRLKKNALSFSGGQQQRICIARTLSIEPEVVLMDEPTSALDPISTSKIEDLVTDLKKDYTIIIVTHNMQQAARISDKTAFFLMGDLIEFDDTKKIFSQSTHKKTEDYITGRFG
ncbi:MAG: pstBB [Clostridia bacterium]|jgi:phosphate transport system ATP-binding protein|nr:pstBB [Clostridia bacterium]